MSVYVTRAGRSSRGKAKVLAFYDLDGTLASLNLLHATAFYLANLGEWSARAGYLARLALSLPRLYMAERQDRRLLNMKLFEAYKGVSRDRLWELGEEYCDRVLIRHLYPHAIEMLEANRAAGIEPVLVTGSPDFLVEPLAHRLKIEHFAANRLVYSRGLATGRMLEPVMAGSEKSAWCESFADGAADRHGRMLGIRRLILRPAFSLRAGASGGRESRPPPVRRRAQPQVADCSFQP